MEYDCIEDPQKLKRFFLPYEFDYTMGSYWQAKKYVAELFQGHLLMVSNVIPDNDWESSFELAKQEILKNFDSLKIKNSRERELSKKEISTLKTLKNYEVTYPNDDIRAILDEDGDVKATYLRLGSNTGYVYFDYKFIRHKNMNIFRALREIDRMWTQIKTFYQNEVAPERALLVKRSELAAAIIREKMSPLRQQLVDDKLTITVKPDEQPLVFRIGAAYEGDEFAHAIFPIEYLEKHTSDIAKDFSDLARLLKSYDVNPYNVKHMKFKEKSND